MLLLGIAAVGGWFARDWLTEKAVALVDQQLSAHGIHLRWGSAAWQQGRGLVLRDVALCETAEKKTPLITAGDIGIHVDLSSLLSGELNLAEAKVTSKRGDIVFYDSAPIMTLADVDLNLLISTDGVRVDHAEVALDHLQLVAKGRYTFPPSKPDSEKPDPEKDEEKKQVAEELKPSLVKLPEIIGQFPLRAGDPNHKPVLDVTFDVANSDTSENPIIKANGTFGCKKNFAYGDLELNSADVAFDFDSTKAQTTLENAQIVFNDRKLRVNRLIVMENGKKLSVEGLDSQVDFLAMIEKVAPKAAEGLASIAYNEAPHITASGNIDIEDMAASALSGEIKKSGIFTVKDKEQQPVIELSQLTGKWKFSEGKVTAEPLKCGIFDGGITLNGTTPVLDPKKVKFKGKVAWENLALEKILAVSSEKQESGNKNSATNKPSETQSDTESPSGIRARITGAFEGSAMAEMNGLTGKGNVSLISEGVDIKGPFVARQGVISTDNLSGTLPGNGQLTMSGETNLAAKPVTFKTKLNVKDLGLPELMTWLGKDTKIAGKLRFEFEGQGSAELADVNGKGAITVTDGRLYSVPVLREINQLLRTVASIFAKERDETLSGDFVVKNGVLHTDNLVVAADLTKVSTTGDYHLAKQEIDLTTTVNIDGTVGLATGIATGLVQIRGTGTVEEPKLSLNLNPVDIVGGVVKGVLDSGDIGTDTVEQVGKTVEKVSGVVGKTIGEGGGGVTEAGKKIGRGLGRLLGRGKKDEKEKEPKKDKP